jgi:hypothetical protein
MLVDIHKDTEITRHNHLHRNDARTLHEELRTVDVSKSALVILPWEQQPFFRHPWAPQPKNPQNFHWLNPEKMANVDSVTHELFLMIINENIF